MMFDGSEYDLPKCLEDRPWLVAVLLLASSAIMLFLCIGSTRFHMETGAGDAGALALFWVMTVFCVILAVVYLILLYRGRDK